VKVLVEADGGSRGNPGPAGYGAVVRDPVTGAVLAERAAGIGRASNNAAEYGGLIAGLQAALELGADEVEVRMDSKLVVEQMSGRWQVKHPAMKPLAREAADLVQRLGRVRFGWIPRAQNSHADRLANEAMDAVRRGEIWRPGGDTGPADAADAWLAEHDTARTPGDPPTSGAPRTPGDPRTPGAPTSGAPTSGAPTSGDPGGDAGVRAPQTPPGSRQERLAGWMAPTAPPTTMLLLRHGQTALSVDKRFSGLGDHGLTEVGRQQAADAGQRLATAGADVVVTSPLLRARQTAEVVAAAAGLEPVVEDGLRETDFGAWEGCTFGEVQLSWPDELAAWLSDTAVAPPDGESFDATAVRVRRARDRLLAAHGGRTLVVVSHVSPIKTLLRFALDAPPSALYRMHLDLACLSEVRWYADGPAVVRSLNDTGHLRRAAPAS